VSKGGCRYGKAGAGEVREGLGTAFASPPTLDRERQHRGLPRDGAWVFGAWRDVTVVLARSTRQLVGVECLRSQNAVQRCRGTPSRQGA
jgi:hypothetical protein